MDQRPRVVVNVDASADGKVTLTREQILMEEPSSRLWAEMIPPVNDQLRPDLMELLRDTYGCNAVLEGSGSLVGAENQPEPLPPDEAESFDPHADFLPSEITELPSPPHRWFTVVDGRGRVRWVQDNPGWNVLVLVAQSTPPAYLAYLRRQNICYLVAGTDRVDLRAALTKMRTKLSIHCVLSNAGGGLNGALLRAGLIDELCVTIAPTLVGGLGTPSIMDGSPLAVGESPTPLRLLSTHQDTTGVVQLRYEVVQQP